METANSTAAAHVNHSHIQQAFDRAKKFIGVYGVFSALVLVLVILFSVMGRDVTSFMWGRAGGVLASALISYWLAGRAARGARSAYLRVRIISVVAPIAIIAIDSIPGALPPWFAVMQIGGAIALLPATFIINRPDIRAAFPKSR
ncbi:hypothetical protein [Streptoalloteichus hindustanus]|uniref:Uncharacterized protein n=1 Tax=Streptoalloteichus hindustanus TaxID=2017 RepID=A0A1M5NAK0_STRHI|nr:hypothetical protein [Streptoalloteichus hindustanus]SHG86229.1 hypothetical protein SAMN05444320_11545 [Streptoalloteichus hindustanus]